jgi:hypothetical protein
MPSSDLPPATQEALRLFTSEGRGHVNKITTTDLHLLLLLLHQRFCTDDLA